MSDLTNLVGVLIDSFYRKTSARLLKYNDQAEKLCRLGATDKELADFFGVEEQTINNWKIQHPQFFESIKAGKIEADANVSESLYKRALGYSHPDVDIKVVDKEIVETELIKHYPPDTTAAIFWLKNRQPDKWRDKQEIDHTSKGEQIKGFNYVAPNDADNQTGTQTAPSVAEA